MWFFLSFFLFFFFLKRNGFLWDKQKNIKGYTPYTKGPPNRERPTINRTKSAFVQNDKIRWVKTKSLSQITSGPSKHYYSSQSECPSMVYGVQFIWLKEKTINLDNFYCVFRFVNSRWSRVRWGLVRVEPTSLHKGVTRCMVFFMEEIR